MSSRFAVALFQSCGIAEDACNRLRAEGVPEAEIGLDMLRRTASVAPTIAPELEALTVDLLVRGDVRNSFTQFVRNGETAVFVRAQSEEETDFALEIMRHYAPIAVDVYAGAEQGAVVGALRARAARRSE